MHITLPKKEKDKIKKDKEERRNLKLAARLLVFETFTEMSFIASFFESRANV